MAGTAFRDDVTYYRQTRPGPEALIEAAVARSLGGILARSANPTWMAGSLPLGAGMPDLLAVTWEPRVLALADPSIADASILAYLRAVGCARLDTIVKRLGRSSANVSSVLEGLIGAAVLVRDSGRFALEPVWRHILPEIVAVEAKVSDWRRAFAQAARNQVLSHRSFVALPDSVARRAVADDTSRALGIGVLGVADDGSVEVLRKAVSQRPRVWAYYYQLAHQVAVNAQLPGKCHSVSR